MKITGHSITAWVRADGTGYYPDCPVCHFYKNMAAGRPCRRSGCPGTVVKVEFQVIDNRVSTP